MTTSPPNPPILGGDEPDSPQHWGRVLVRVAGALVRGLLADGSETDPPRWHIQPEPTDEELVALVTTLSVALAPPAEPEPSAPSSRWARAGRVAALASWPPTTSRGWRRRP